MTENTIVKRISSVLLTFIVTISMLLPSMLFPSEVRAGTTYNTYFKKTGKTVVVNWGNLNGKYGGYYNQDAEYFSTSPYSGKTVPGFCVDPSEVFNAGQRPGYNFNGYKSSKTGYVFSRTEDKRLAIGLHYIRNRAPNMPDYAARITMCQLFTWENVQGKYTPYKAWLDLDSGNNRVLKDLYDRVRAEAEQYINDHWNDMDGWCYVYPANNQDIVTFEIKEKSKAKLKKTTKNNKHLTDICPELYSLKGAEYKVYSDSSLTKYVGTLTTDENGNTNTLSLNDGKYFVKETKSPPGYRLDDKVYQLNVTPGDTAVLSVSDEPLFDPLDLKIIKKSENVPNSNLSLEGAEYTVKYYKDFLNEQQVKSSNPFRTWIFRTDKKGHIKFNDDYKIGGDELFKDDNSRPVGLQGTYTIEETKEPKGFLRTEGIISLQQVRTNGKSTAVTSLKDVTDIEKIQKVNIKIQKKDAETGSEKPQGYGSFAGAKFNVWFHDPLQVMDVLVGTIVTNENGTGELVKLAPGVYMIEEIEAPSGYNKTTKKIKLDAKVKEPNVAFFDYLTDIPQKPITINVKKTSFDETGKVIYLEGAVLALFNDRDEKIEEWTSTGKGHTFKALPKGNYYIKELRTPKGYLPLEKDYHFTVKETEDLQEPAVFNEPIPEINTIATFDTGVKESMPKDKVTVVDRFEYKKVIKGSPYAIKAKLVEKDNVNNVIAEGYKEFSPSDYSGEEKIEFTFNAEKLENKRLVVLAELHRLSRIDNTLVAVHKDINNMDETVVFPAIKTKAVDKIDEKKDMLAGEKQTIVDKVSYTNLIIGTKYNVSGKLMDKQTGKPILVDGKEITAKKEFTAKTKDGFVELEFTLDTKALAGKTVVVFEDLYKDKIKVATHSEITDKDQSIYIPKIGTKLAEKDTGKKELHPSANIKLTDEIAYENLIAGEKYFVKGRIVNKKTGEVISKSEKEFVADTESGTVKLDFDLNAEKLEGVKLVCFEEVYKIDEDGKPGKLVADHKDINDENQSIGIIKKEITKTGDGAKTVAYILGLVIAAIAVIAIKVRKTRKN